MQLITRKSLIEMSERPRVSSVVVAWLLCVCAQSVSAGYERVCMEDNTRTRYKGVCGSALSEILKTVCRFHGYNGMRKRSDDAPPKALHIPLTSSNGNIFMDKPGALAVLQKRGYDWKLQPGLYQGIVCECCVNQCGIDEMFQYCASPEDAYSKRASTWSRLPPLYTQLSRNTQPPNRADDLENGGSGDVYHGDRARNTFTQFDQQMNRNKGNVIVERLLEYPSQKDSGRNFP